MLVPMQEPVLPVCVPLDGSEFHFFSDYIVAYHMLVAVRGSGGTSKRVIFTVYMYKRKLNQQKVEEVVVKVDGVT